MGEPRKWFRFAIGRFSLRALLVIVTLCCIVLAYRANLRQRQRQLVAEQIQKFRSDYLKPMRLSGRVGPLSCFQKQSSGALEWISPRSYASIAIAIPISDVTSHSFESKDYLWITTAQKDYRAAKLLFPGTVVIPFTETKDGWEQVFLRDSTDGTPIPGSEN